jgi:hypothetical protein
MGACAPMGERIEVMVKVLIAVIVDNGSFMNTVFVRLILYGKVWMKE